MIKKWIVVITVISVTSFIISNRQKVPVSNLERETNSNGCDSSGNTIVQLENLNRRLIERMNAKVPENGTSKVNKINGTFFL